MTTRDASAIPARLAGGRRRKGLKANGGKGLKANGGKGQGANGGKGPGADNRGKGGR